MPSAVAAPGTAAAAAGWRSAAAAAAVGWRSAAAAWRSAAVVGTAGTAWRSAAAVAAAAPTAAWA